MVDLEFTDPLEQRLDTSALWFTAASCTPGGEKGDPKVDRPQFSPEIVVLPTVGGVYHGDLA